MYRLIIGNLKLGTISGPFSIRDYLEKQPKMTPDPTLVISDLTRFSPFIASYV